MAKHRKTSVPHPSKQKPKEFHISDAKLQEVISWTPHEKQQEILDAFTHQDELVLCAGRRFGKSALCAYIALRTLLQPGKKVWIVAPSYDLAQKVFSYAAQWFPKVLPSESSKAIRQNPRPHIITSQGSTLECKTADNPVSLLGEELDLIIVDEAARIDASIWQQYLYPTTASRNGKVIFISTPLGRNWFYHEFQQMKQNGAAFRFRSIDNPHGVPKDHWDDAKRRLPPQLFQQEYEADFVDDATAVFRGVRDCVKQGIEQDAVPGHYYVMGVDLAKYHDFTVLTVIDTNTHEVVHIDRFKDLDWQKQRARILATAQRYNNARVVIDSSGVGDPIVDELTNEGLMVDDIQYTTKNKHRIVEKLMITFQDRLISIPPHDILIDELESFGFKMTSHGNIQYKAPSGQHDDCVNSLALAVWMLQGKPQRFNRQSHIKKELDKVHKGRKKRTSFI